MTSKMIFEKSTSKKDNFLYYLSKAREQSLKSQVSKAKIGSVLIRNGKIISTGYNKIRGASAIDGKFSRWAESLHSEVDCLKKVMFNNIKGSTLIVYREKKSGEIANCKPCDYCMAFIQFLKIKRIVYTFPEFPYYKIEEV